MMNQPDWGGDAPEVDGPGSAAPLDEAAVDAKALRASALRQARRLVEFYRITPQELLEAGEPAGARPAPQWAQPDRPIKYRHPVSGDTWDGVGPHPPWMRQALLQDGYRVEELRINPVLEDHHARPIA